MLVYTRKNRKLFSDADGAGLYLRRCLFVLFTKWTFHHRDSQKIAHTRTVSAFPLGPSGMPLWSGVKLFVSLIIFRFGCFAKLRFGQELKNCDILVKKRG